MSMLFLKLFDPRNKYAYLQILRSSGLTSNVMMLTYSHGNNIRNLHFLWKVSDTDDAMSNSQQTIEKAKEEIPYLPHQSNEACFI